MWFTPNTNLILEQPDVVVGGLRVEFSLSLQVELQSLHVEPEVSGVWVGLRRIAAETKPRWGPRTGRGRWVVVNAEGGSPVEQLLIRQEVIDARDVDQPEAEHGNVGVGGEDPDDAGREGHRQVARDLHQAAEGRWNAQTVCHSYGQRRSGRDVSQNSRVFVKSVTLLTGCAVHLWSRRWCTRLWLLPQARPPVYWEKWGWGLWTGALWRTYVDTFTTLMSDDGICCKARMSACRCLHCLCWWSWRW